MSVYNDIRASFVLDFLTTAGTTHLNLSLDDLTIAVATELAFLGMQSIPTSDTAINLGPISTPRLFAAVNLDGTNYIEIKTGSAGSVVAKLLAGEGCLIPLGSNMLAPYAKANTAACVLKYLLISL